MPRKLRIQYPGAMYYVMNRGRAKGHSGKVVIARRLRQETTLSLKWIAERLAMGTWTCVPNLLHENADDSPVQEVLPLCRW